MLLVAVSALGQRPDLTRRMAGSALKLSHGKDARFR